MYLFIVVLAVFILAKIFIKNFRQTNFQNIIFYKSNLQDQLTDDNELTDENELPNNNEFGEEDKQNNLTNLVGSE